MPLKLNNAISPSSLRMLPNLKIGSSRRPQFRQVFKSNIPRTQAGQRSQNGAIMAQQSKKWIVEEKVGTGNRHQHRGQHDDNAGDHKVDRKPEHVSIVVSSIPTEKHSLLKAAPFLRLRAYRACARRACIRSAHLLLARFLRLRAIALRPCRACIRSAHLLLAAPYRACIRSAHVGSAYGQRTGLSMPSP